LSEIDPTAVCLSGFAVKPDLNLLAEILFEAGELRRLKSVPTKSTNTLRNHYIFVHFVPNDFNKDTAEKCKTLATQLKQKDEKILCITRDSNVDQVFVGSLNRSLTEKDLVDSLDFGNLIHFEIKRRDKEVNNYGFATLVDSQASIQKLIDTKFFTVKGYLIELREKLKKITKRDALCFVPPARIYDDFNSPPMCPPPMRLPAPMFSPAPMFHDCRKIFMRSMRKEAYLQQLDADFLKAQLRKNPKMRQVWRQFAMRKMRTESPEFPSMSQRRDFDMFRLRQK